MKDKQEKFRQLLEDGHTWPCFYDFKFIVPSGQLSILKALFEENVEFKERPSSEGKYTSLSVRAFLQSPEEVIEIYQKVSVIKGIISL